MPGIHEILKECRDRAGYTQEELASKLYVDRSTVTKIETGVVKQPSYSVVKEWARITNSEDIVGLDFAGNDGWKRLRTMETAINQIKSAVELVSMS